MQQIDGLSIITGNYTQVPVFGTYTVSRETLRPIYEIIQANIKGTFIRMKPNMMSWACIPILFDASEARRRNAVHRKKKVPKNLRTKKIIRKNSWHSNSWYSETNRGARAWCTSITHIRQKPRLNNLRQIRPKVSQAKQQPFHLANSKLKQTKKHQNPNNVCSLWSMYVLWMHGMFFFFPNTVRLRIETFFSFSITRVRMRKKTRNIQL